MKLKLGWLIVLAVFLAACFQDVSNSNPWTAEGQHITLTIPAAWQITTKGDYCLGGRADCFMQILINERTYATFHEYPLLETETPQQISDSFWAGYTAEAGDKLDLKAETTATIGGQPARIREFFYDDDEGLLYVMRVDVLHPRVFVILTFWAQTQGSFEQDRADVVSMANSLLFKP